MGRPAAGHFMDKVRYAGAGLRCVGREQLEEIQQAAEQLKNELDIVSGVCRNGLDSFDRARQLGL